jgi:hypothetical protein
MLRDGPFFSTTEAGMTEATTTRMEWRATNRALWEERAAIHLAPGGYDLGPLRTGVAALDGIVEAELGSVEGLRILHLQCHIGRDTLVLAQRGADVTGIDFSGAAIAAARGLAEELGLSSRARFVECDLYAAREALRQLVPFDLVFVTWARCVGSPTYSAGRVSRRSACDRAGGSIWRRGIPLRMSLTTRRRPTIPPNRAGSRRILRLARSKPRRPRTTPIGVRSSFTRAWSPGCTRSLR